MQKEQILETLKQVIYFPKRENIVALEMIKNFKLENKNINFDLVFPDLNDPGIKTVVDTCVSTIQQTFGNETVVGVNPVAEKAAGEGPLSGVKNILAVARKHNIADSTIHTWLKKLMLIHQTTKVLINLRNFKKKNQILS